ncbi:uncharacterized protein EURHEDRAFT_94274 [Aspergillus ruber CBS 135680]|uniref:Uncharacterized protein n=1 Tax=Aspergillus ruber (strain CBS 135680) TaxID=1388766 RepID=A0A017SD15_ASPRC|nr:uncharacterized protein EURHEDRAFT_94274 [Aspergillus ruber CBS 135680]EYE94519.1 hypothetical protein EURHEDRAFT_94274 [Aspergillus ruber CBS 135680]
MIQNTFYIYILVSCVILALRDLRAELFRDNLMGGLLANYPHPSQCRKAPSLHPLHLHDPCRSHRLQYQQLQF